MLVVILLTCVSRSGVDLKNFKWWLLLVKSSSEVFVMLVDIHCCFCDAVFHLLLFDVILTLPWAIARFLHPFCTFRPAHHRVVRDTFTLTFLDLLCYSFTSATVLSELFSPTCIFYLMLLPNIFGTTCFYQGLSGSQQFFVEVCRASCWPSKHRPSPSVCLSHNNLQKEYE